MSIARGSWIGIVRLAASLCLIAPTAAPAQDFLAFGGELQVNSSTVAYQGHPDVGVATSGEFVVTWESNTQSPFGIFARHFDATEKRWASSSRSTPPPWRLIARTSA